MKTPCSQNRTMKDLTDDEIIDKLESLVLIEVDSQGKLQLRDGKDLHEFNSILDECASRGIDPKELTKRVNHWQVVRFDE